MGIVACRLADRGLSKQGLAALRLGAIDRVHTAVGFSARNRRASGSEFSVFDALSLWNARHEAARAAEFYSADIYWLALVLLGGFAVLAVPPVPSSAKIKRWLTRLAWVPAVPVVAIVAIVLVKEGGGSEVLPTQFAPLSVGAVVVSKVALNPLPKRQSGRVDMAGSVRSGGAACAIDAATFSGRARRRRSPHCDFRR